MFISTFLNNSEKEAFAFELAGSDVKLMSAALKQVFKTIPPSTITVKAENVFAEAGREKGVFSEKNDVREVKKWLLNCKTIAFTLSFDSFYTLKA